MREPSFSSLSVRVDTRLFVPSTEETDFPSKFEGFLVTSLYKLLALWLPTLKCVPPRTSAPLELYVRI